jgi:hypothetical protein
MRAVFAVLLFFAGLAFARQEIRAVPPELVACAGALWGLACAAMARGD